MYKYYKLVTGEEIIGEWEGENGFTVTLKNPKVITLIPSQTGTNVTLIPLMWSAKPDTSVAIHINNILAETYVIDEKFERMYLQSTSRLDLTSKL